MLVFEVSFIGRSGVLSSEQCVQYSAAAYKHEQHWKNGEKGHASQAPAKDSLHGVLGIYVADGLGPHGIAADQFPFYRNIRWKIRP